MLDGVSAVGSRMLGGRFQLVRRLGAGAFGTVYEAEDIDYKQRIAVKQLNVLDGDALYRFKQEFRSAQDIVHPNIVALKELFSADGHWYMTMEFIDGVDFRAWLRGDAPLIPLMPDDREETKRWKADHPPDVITKSYSAAYDEARLRVALVQLIEAVHALHRHNVLHRDLKPSNVMVSADARLRVLDYGLAAPIGREGLHTSSDELVVGTPGYMSPEQAEGAALSTPSDWYSVGAMVFEVLTGKLPFEGATRDVLWRKVHEDGPDPRIHDRELPEDLADMCRRLLVRDTAARPSYEELVAIVGRAAAGAEVPVFVGDTVFVGRTSELATLKHAAERAVERSVVVHVQGPSGVGKSALVRRFVEDVDAVVLAGRCFERESVPFKALDSLVDALTQHLRGLTRAEVESVVPQHAAALARVFPVLSRLDAFAGVRAVDRVTDPNEIRRRAATALRELLGRLAKLRPLVLWIDDLQWGDADSAVLFRELVAPPDPPPMLLVLGYRIEDAAAEMVAAVRGRRSVDHWVELAIQPLGALEAEQLASTLLGVRSSQARRVASESGGIPFFVHELARTVTSGNSLDNLSLADVLAQADRGVARECAALARCRRCGGRSDHSARRAQRRGHRPRRGDPAARRALPALARRWRRRSGRVLSRSRARDRARAARRSDRDPSRDRRRARARADSRSRGDRRAVSAPPATTRRRWSTPSARRSSPSTSSRSIAPSICTRSRRGSRRRIAASTSRCATPRRSRTPGAVPPPQPHFGSLPMARPATQRCGCARAPPSSSCAPASSTKASSSSSRRCAHLDLRLPRHAAQRARHAARAPRALEAARPRVRPSATRRASRSYPPRTFIASICVGRSATASAVSTWCAPRRSKHSTCCSRSTPASRIACRARLAWESIVRSMEGGPKGRRRAAELGASAKAIADRIAHPHARAWAAATEAIAAECEGRWRDAQRHSFVTIALFREAQTDVAWEVGSMYAWWLLPALYMAGDLVGARVSRTAAVADADAVGDLYTATSLRTYLMPHVHLVAGNPERADAERADAMRQVVARRLASPTLGRPQGARRDRAVPRRRCRRRRARGMPSARQLSSSLLMRMCMVGIQTRYSLGRALVLASESDRSPALLRRAAKCAAQLAHDDTAGRKQFGHTIEAGVAMRRGDRDRALALLATAADGFRSIDMSLHANACDLVRGRAIGGESGRQLVAAAETRGCASQDVADPLALARSLVPGFTIDN